ncbi:MAG: diaminopimelate epimerase [Nitrospirota bacterium]|jgi:diaminopimelate epimerase
MRLPFTKMHGLGNDFVVLDGLSRTLPDLAPHARHLCDRRFGIGCDQLLVIATPTEPSCDFRMQIYNADGSEVEMCGNGIRCFARYLVDRGLTTKEEIRVETGAGVIVPRLVGDGVRVDMGPPVLEGREIPVDLDGMVMSHPLEVAGARLPFTCVSMGNPHAVTFVEAVVAVDLSRLGPALEHHPFFPRRVNVEFVQIDGPDEVTVRVWERGAGETLACGTGAAAVCVAGVLEGRTEREVTVHLPGGDLALEWSERDDHVYMTGPTAEVFSGEIEL